MADQLLFRGGNTTSIAGSTVSSREIVIDTQTNQIVLGSQKDRTVMQDGATEEVTITGGVAKLRLNSSGSTHPLQIYQDGTDGFIKNSASSGKITFNTFGGGYLSYISGSTERVRFDSNGNVSIGGTIGSAPAIELTQGGGGLFNGLVSTHYYFKSNRTSNAFVFQGVLNGVTTALIKSDGSATFSGAIVSGGNPNAGGAAGSRMRSGGGVQACATGGSTNVWAGFQEGTSTSTSSISASGAATFSSYLQVGDNPANGSANGARLNNTGIVLAARSATDDRVWAGYQVGSTNTTSFITAGGRASFDGAVTASNITAFKNSLTTGAAAATSLSELQSAIATALALL